MTTKNERNANHDRANLAIRQKLVASLWDCSCAVDAGHEDPTDLVGQIQRAIRVCEGLS